MDNGNEQNTEGFNNQGNYKVNNYNYKINQNLDNYSPNIINKKLVSYNNNEISNIKEDKQKYNFKPELLKDINKIPKSGGLNFENNKPKNFNYFQFQFDRNENRSENNLNMNNVINNNIEKPYEYIQNNINNENEFQSKNKFRNNNKNCINFEELEKERRKQDLLQMINFSSNLKINNSNNNNDYENYNIVQSYED